LVRTSWRLGVVVVMVVRAGTLLALVPLPGVPAPGFLVADDRGLMDLAIACCVPFAELSDQSGPPET
jgi:hypothetical protein